MNKALLPSLFGEAALAPTDPLKNEVSPFTTMGALAPGQTNFSSTPFTPAPIPESGGIDWVKALKAAPDIINQGKKIFNV